MSQKRRSSTWGKMTNAVQNILGKMKKGQSEQYYETGVADEDEAWDEGW